MPTEQQARAHQHAGAAHMSSKTTPPRAIKLRRTQPYTS